MKTLIIMRGLPGSGKSTLISKLEEQYNMKATICSADYFWYGDREHTPENYQFDLSKIGSAHKWCQSNAKKAMERGDQLIIIDNTNLTLKEYKVYALTGAENGYTIIAHSIVGCTAEQSCNSNVHNVPMEACVKMKKRYDRAVRKIQGTNIVAEIQEIVHDYGWLRKGILGNGKFGQKN